MLVTTGGGGDGYKVIDTYLTMLEHHPQPGFKSMIVTGLMLAEDNDQLAVRARKLKVRIVKFYRKMEKAILAADCVVSMGGYVRPAAKSSALTRPSPIVPRSTPREEHHPARIFADKDLEYIPWETVEAEPMRERIEVLLRDGSARYEERLRDFPHDRF